MAMRVVVSGGGTGGHIYPALAVSEGLQRLESEMELLYIGAKTGMETTLVPEQGVPFQAVTAKKLQKVFSLSTVRVMFSLFQGYREARTYLKAFRAEVVVGTGGYVAAAAVRAGVSLRLPTVILAPDAVPGRTNLWLARYANRICVVFPETVTHFPKEKTLVTGLPLRESIVAPKEITPQIARQRFSGLTENKFTVLIIGGSQGAQAVNRCVVETLPELLEVGMQVLHQTGTKNWEDVKAQAEAKGVWGREGYCPLAFMDAEQMPLALRAADVIVCRGGISSLSEAMVNGLPTIVVPLPTAYADHQTANAKALVAQGAALLCPQSELTLERLKRDLTALRADSNQCQQMSHAARTVGQPDATHKVCQEIVRLIKR